MRIFRNVVRYFRSYFVRKYVNKKRNVKSWLWKQRRKRNIKKWLWKQRSSIKKKILIPPHPLTNFEIFMRMNLDLMEFILETICLKKRKDGAYVINLYENADVGIHSIALDNSNIEIIYFRTLGVEHVPKEIPKNIKKTYLEYKQTIQ